MKQFKYLILFVSLLFVSCCNYQQENPEFLNTSDVKNIKVVVIDSCEYFQYVNYSHVITHKGNCKYCAERMQKLFQTYY